MVPSGLVMDAALAALIRANAYHHLAAALFVFVPSMGVFAIPVLLGGGKEIILGNLIVQLFLEFRNIPMGAAVSMLLLALSGIGILLYMRALRRVEAMK